MEENKDSGEKAPQNKDFEEKIEEAEKNAAGECGENCECHHEGTNALKEQLDECKKQSEEYLNGWKRARADYLNYRNEEADRLTVLLNACREDVIADILPVLDNFNLVLKEIPEDKLKDAHIDGIAKVKTQLESVLKSYGVEEVEAEGQKFDPNMHEVVAEVEAEGKEPGTVVEVTQKGYTVNGRLLRPAKVKVTK